MPKLNRNQKKNQKVTFDDRTSPGHHRKGGKDTRPISSVRNDISQRCIVHSKPKKMGEAIDQEDRNDAVKQMFSMWDEALGQAVVIEIGDKNYRKQNFSKMGVSKGGGEVENPLRLSHIACFVIILPSSESLSIIRSLRYEPHYMRTKEELNNLLLGKPGCNIPFTTVEENCPLSGVAESFAYLYRDVSEHLDEDAKDKCDLLTKEFCSKVVGMVLQHGQGDATRGNRYIDFGYSCGKNLNGRDGQGIAFPQLRSLPKGCDESRVQAACLALSVMFEAVFKKKMDPAR